jgi:hypothetical protein
MIIVKHIKARPPRGPERLWRGAALAAGLAAVLAITALSPVSALAGAKARPASMAGTSAPSFGAQQAALYPIQRQLPATFQGSCTAVRHELSELARKGVHRVACTQPAPASALPHRTREALGVPSCLPLLIVTFRHSSCGLTSIDYSIINPDNGDVLGTGVIGVKYQETLNSNSWKWDLHLQIVLAAATDAVLTGTGADVGIACVNCSTAVLPWVTPLVLGVPESHTWAIAAHSAPKVITTRQAPIVAITNPQATDQAPPVPLGNLGPARCDKLAWTTKTRTTQGCVFSNVAAVYIVYLTRHNMDKVAENIEIAQQTKPHHFGWFGHGKPLTRANNAEIANANRKTACRGTNYHRPWSCDEYPFADTYQGAFFFPHDNRTAKVLQTQNSTEGQARQQFYNSERLISAVSLHILDPYWVVVMP